MQSIINPTRTVTSRHPRPIAARGVVRVDG